MNNYVYQNIDITYEINDISILLELKRYILVNDIKNKCKEYFIHKKLGLNINNILPRWIMLQYNFKNDKDKYNYVDPILPFNGRNNSQLKKDLYIFLEKKYSYDEINKIVEDLNLKEKFNDAIIKLKNFMKTDLYIKNKDSIEIIIDFIDSFYHFKFKHNNKIYTKKDLKIHKDVLDKMYTNSDKNLSPEMFINLVLSIIIRYDILESFNQQLAVNPEFYNYLKDEYNVNFELFGSSINCFYQNYCSLFYDLEKYFGSKGNFNFVSLQKGFYVSNPPFDEKLMENMSRKLVGFLENNNDDLTILITIPVWDNEDYGLYKALDILKKSPYITYIENMKKKRTKFYDYFKNKYISPCNIYFILLQNEKGIAKYNIANNMKNILLKFFP